MPARKPKERHSTKIVVHGHLHTIIEQDPQRPPHFKGNYQGHEGYVLKKVESINK